MTCEPWSVVRAAAAPPGADVANFPGVSASMAEVVAAIEAAVPEAVGRITWEETTLPFPAKLEARALEELVGPLPRTSIVEGVSATIERFRRSAAHGL